MEIAEEQGLLAGIPQRTTHNAGNPLSEVPPGTPDPEPEIVEDAPDPVAISLTEAAHDPHTCSMCGAQAKENPCEYCGKFETNLKEMEKINE
jgi:hypothetical protein